MCRKAIYVCVHICAIQACQAVLSPWSSQSHWTLNSYLLPSNQDFCHTRSCLISTLCLEERNEEFWDIPKLTKIDWQFTLCVTVKNHLLKIAHFSKKFPTSSKMVFTGWALHWAESMLVFFMNKDRDLNTMHLCDQPASVKKLLRCQPQFYCLACSDWLRFPPRILLLLLCNWRAALWIELMILIPKRK